MSRFASQYRRSGAPALVRQFGETVIYYARGVGDGRTIQGIVTRGQSVGPTGHTAQQIDIEVIDSAAIGISASEVDDGCDQIGVALIQGGDLQRREITLVPDDSNGMVRLRVR